MQGKENAQHQIQHAGEGDLRLVDESSFSNWVIGRPEVFFEGSWSQVCAARFGAADANVACRQLGYGAGTVVPQFTSEFDLQAPPRLVPPVAITESGCTGSEERLIDCGPDESEDYEIRPEFATGCLGTSTLDPGLVLGCVAAPDNGATA